MLWIVGIAMGTFILTCSAVGLRLLWLAVRTRQAPELLGGLGFASIGLIGYPASLASGNGVEPVGDVWIPAYVVGMVFTNAGIAAFYAFTYRVFRPFSTRARALVGAAISALAFGSAGSIRTILTADPALPSLDATASWSLLLQVASTLAFGWTSLEGFVQARMAGRRAALGLADRSTVHRFWLWGVFGASTTMLSLAFLVSQQLGRAPAEDPMVHVASALLGGLSSAVMALAFFPPKAYTRRVSSRARTT